MKTTLSALGLILGCSFAMAQNEKSLDARVYYYDCEAAKTQPGSLTTKQKDELRQSKIPSLFVRAVGDPQNPVINIRYSRMEPDRDDPSENGKTPKMSLLFSGTMSRFTLADRANEASRFIYAAKRVASHTGEGFSCLAKDVGDTAIKLRTFGMRFLQENRENNSRNKRFPYGSALAAPEPEFTGAPSQ